MELGSICVKEFELLKCKMIESENGNIGVFLEKNIYKENFYRVRYDIPLKHNRNASCCKDFSEKVLAEYCYTTDTVYEEFINELKFKN